ncbi:hypothetical protein D3C83_117380 [compost metagenome]
MLLTEALTRESVVAGVERDARYSDLELRCTVLRQLQALRALDAQTYAERCPDFPLASAVMR